MARKSINQLLRDSASATEKPDSQKLPSQRQPDTTPSTGSVASQLRRRRLNTSPISRKEIYYGSELGQDFGQMENYIPYEERNVGNMENWEEQAAQNQTAWDQTLNGMGRMLMRAGTEIGKAPGYIGGGLSAIISGDVTDITNNFWVEAFQKLDDNAKEQMPVFWRESIQNGTLSQQMLSPEFWASEGADAIGFLLGAIAGGYGIGAGVKGLGLTANLAKSMNLGAKAMNTMDDLAIAGGQTFLESAAEAKNYNDAMMAELPNMRQSDGSYIVNGKTGLNYQQAKNEIAKGTAGVLKWNSVMLMGPNLRQTRYLFGKSENLDGIFKGLRGKSASEIAEEVKTLTPWKRQWKNVGMEGGKGAIPEAFQELSQFGIEDYYDKKIKGQTSKGQIDGIISGMIEGLNTVEGQKSALLGAILGFGPGTIGAYRKNKAESTRRSKLSQLLDNNIKSMEETITGFAKRNADGTFQVDKDGNWVMDENKLKEYFDSEIEDTVLSKILTSALASGDVDSARVAMAELALRRVQNFVSVEGGLDIWKGSIEELANNIGAEASKLGFKSKQEMAGFLNGIAEQAQKEFYKVRNYGPRFFGIDAIKENIEQRDEFYNKIENTAIRLKALQSVYTNRINTISNQMNELYTEADENLYNLTKTPMTLEEFEKEMSRKTPAQKRKAVEKAAGREYKALKDKKDKIEEALKENKKNYELLFNKKEQQKYFDQMIKDKEEFAEIAQEERKEQKDFVDMLKEKGYDVGKYINEEGADDWHEENIALTNEKDNRVFVIGTRANKTTGAKEFVLRDVVTREEYDFNVDNLKRLGLHNEDAIVPKENVKEIIRANIIISKNQLALESLTRGINAQSRRVLGKSRRTGESMEDTLNRRKTELKRLEALHEYFMQQQEIPLKDIMTEVEDLKLQMLEIKEEIQDLEESLKEFQVFSRRATEIKEELEDLVETGSQEVFKVGRRLDELLEQLINGDLELDIETINNSIEAIKDSLPTLRQAESYLQMAIDDLVDKIKTLDGIEDIFLAEGLTESLIQRLQEVTSADIMGDFKNLLGAIQSNASGYAAIDILREIRNLRADLVESKTMLQEEYSLSNALQRLNELYNNKDLLERYEFLEKNKHLITTSRAEFFSSESAELEEDDHQNHHASSPQAIEQDDKTKEEFRKGMMKWDPWSSSIRQFEPLRDKDGVIVRDEETGHIVWSDTPVENPQAYNFSTALHELNLRDVKANRYVARVMNAETFYTEFGEQPPRDEKRNKEDDLYVAVFDVKEKDYVKHEGIPVFGGIAYTDTYFTRGEISIDVKRIPKYKGFFTAQKRKSLKEGLAIPFNGQDYTSIETLEAAIIESVEQEYDNWRKTLVANAKEGTVDLQINSISAGIPQRINGVKNKASDVFSIKSLIIPITNFFTNKASQVDQPVVRGGVYAEIENGQMVLLNNNKIGDLPPKSREAYIERILRMMTLSDFIEGGKKLKDASFSYAGETKATVKYTSSKAGDFGVFDHILNWGHVKKTGYPYPIGLKAINKKDLSKGYKVVFKLDGISYQVPVSEIYDMEETLKQGKPVLNPLDSPKLTKLIQFLESKYTNVARPLLNKKEVKMPRSYNLKKNSKGETIAEITYDTIEDYNKHVLDKLTYTNIEERRPGVPLFMSKYITFDTKKLENLPEIEYEEDPDVASDNPESISKLIGRQKVWYQDAIDEFGGNPFKNRTKAQRKSIEKSIQKVIDESSGAKQIAYGIYLKNIKKGIVVDKVAGVQKGFTPDSINVRPVSVRQDGKLQFTPESIQEELPEEVEKEDDPQEFCDDANKNSMKPKTDGPGGFKPRTRKKL